MIRRTLAAVVLLLAAIAVATAQPLDGYSREEAAHNDITALLHETAVLSLPARVERAFVLTLNGAGDAILQGEHGKALTLLRTFAFEVRSCKRARRIPAGVADLLIEKAEKLMATLTVPAPQ